MFIGTQHGTVESDGFITLYPRQAAVSVGAGGGSAADDPSTISEDAGDEVASDPTRRHGGG